MKAVTLLIFCLLISCNTTTRNNFEGVYSAKGRHGIEVIELNNGRFKYWSKKLPYFASNYVYEKEEGTYTLTGNYLTLDNQSFFVKRMIFKEVKGQQTLMNEHNHKLWQSKNEIDTWGILFKTPLKSVTGNYEEVYKTLE